MTKHDAVSGEHGGRIVNIGCLCDACIVLGKRTVKTG